MEIGDYIQGLGSYWRDPIGKIIGKDGNMFIVEWSSGKKIVIPENRIVAYTVIGKGNIETGWGTEDITK